MGVTCLLLRALPPETTTTKCVFWLWTFFCEPHLEEELRWGEICPSSLPPVLSLMIRIYYAPTVCLDCGSLPTPEPVRTLRMREWPRVW